MKRVLLSTDRRELIGMIRRTPGLQVVTCVHPRASLPPAARQLAPDVVLVDQRGAPPEVTLERLAESERRMGDVKRVMVASRMDTAWVAAAFAAGANAIISADVLPANLGIVLLELAENHIVQPSRPDARALTHETPLSPRELEILRLVARGLSNRQVATRLYVVEQTVKYHLSNTYRKLGVANRTEATHYAHQHALVGQDELRPAA